MSIRDHAQNVKHKVIVVDNNSSDGSVEMVLSRFRGVHLIRNERNIGFAAANNIGMRVAEGPYVLFLNPDTILTPHALTKAIDYLNRHEAVGVLGCKLLNTDGSFQPSARDFPTLWSVLLESTFLYKLLPHFKGIGNPWVLSAEQPVNVDVVKGAFFLVRRKALEQVGGFDERFFLYSEEQDWCLRARKLGWSVVYYPDVHIFHRDGAAGSSGPNSSKFMLYESEGKYFRKHYGAFSSLAARSLMVIGIVLRVVLWAAVSPFEKVFAFKESPLARLKHYCNALLWHVRKVF
jgi:hypothetical protein